MQKDLRIKIALVTALRHIEFFKHNYNEDLTTQYLSVVIEAEKALRDVQNQNVILPISFNKDSLISNYTRLRKMINMPDLKNKIFDIEDLCIINNCVTLSSKYYREKREFDEQQK